jgi:hypothetical protein
VAKAIPENLTITGLDHLVGEEVVIIIDGALEPRQTVAAGQVVVERAGTEAVIGLPYNALARGLPPIRDGKARLASLGVQLVDSALPKINGKRPDDRTPATPQDQAEPLRTGKFEVDADLGWEAEGTFEIEQDLPFRTEVVAVFGTAQANRAK